MSQVGGEERARAAWAVFYLKSALARLAATDPGPPPIASLTDLEPRSTEPGVARLVHFALNPRLYVDRSSLTDESIDELLSWIGDAASTRENGTLDQEMGQLPTTPFERGKMREAVRAWLELAARDL